MVTHIRTVPDRFDSLDVTVRCALAPLVTDPSAGRRLRALVERQRPGDVTWEEFAAAVGVTKSALLSWFAGQEPSMGSLRGLATVLGVPRWELVRTWDGD